MQQLNICTFKGLQNLPIYVARQQNFFAQHGLDIEIAYTTGSIPQLAGLVHEEYQLIQTAPDNVINIDNNFAAFELDSATASHILMLLGGSVGTLSIYSQTDITTFDHMRGSVLGVDNPSSGFALVLRDMLARNGLLLEHDYTFSVAGGTSNRLDALKKGSVAATILYLPFDEQAAQAGFNKLATSTDYYAAYAAFGDLKTGFGETAKLDDAGLQQVIDLRTTYASTPKLTESWLIIVFFVGIPREKVQLVITTGIIYTYTTLLMPGVAIPRWKCLKLLRANSVTCSFSIY